MENLAASLDHQAARRPDKVVLTHGSVTRTNTQLLERVNALAAALREKGVGEGGIVAILLYNRIEFIETVYAVARLGASFLPLNFRLSPAEWEYILGHAGAQVVVVDADFAEQLQSVADGLDALSTVIRLPHPDTGQGADDFGPLVSAHLGETVPTVDVPGEAMQRLMYTSGTTSRPKGVVISHRNYLAKTLGMLLLLGWDDTEVAVVSGPLYHVGALDMGGLTVLHAGGSLVLQTKYDAAEALELIEAHRATNIWLAPAMVNGILQHKRTDEADLTSLRLMISGGEKMPEARLTQLLDRVPGLWFADAYGLTETVSGDTYMTKESMLDKLGSVGRPVPHLQIRIVDDAGHGVPVGETGEVTLRGPKVFSEYWRDPDATAAAIRDGWFHTGDVGWLDEDGFLYIADRKKDMIVSGGENIATPEVERVLYEHPDVVEAAVIGMSHERWGEVPHAFVVRREGSDASADQIRDFCAARLAKFKVPQRITLIDTLPRTPSGKVLKRKLREDAR